MAVSMLAPVPLVACIQSLPEGRAPMADVPVSLDDQIETQKSTRLQDRLWKTQVCRFYTSASGCRDGESCAYAHGSDELKPQPDLKKTCICRRWIRGNCPLSSEDCTFAHGSDELYRARFRKTQMCRYFQTTGCRYAEACPFAHGEHELTAPPDLTKTSICKAWAQGICRFDASECPFAHGVTDLRDETFADEEDIPTPPSCDQDVASVQSSGPNDQDLRASTRLRLKNKPLRSKRGRRGSRKMLVDSDFDSKADDDEGFQVSASDKDQAFVVQSDDVIILHNSYMCRDDGALHSQPTQNIKQPIIPVQSLLPSRQKEKANMVGLESFVGLPYAQQRAKSNIVGRENLVGLPFVTFQSVSGMSPTVEKSPNGSCEELATYIELISSCYMD